MTSRWPANLVVGPMTPADAVTISTWQYDGPWRVYNLDGQIPSAVVDYHSIRSLTDNSLIGFFCVGEEARIPGIAEARGTLDLGWGMNPAWTGRGYGRAFGSVVLPAAQNLGVFNQVRAVVQSWNERSIRVLKALGFKQAAEHVCVQRGRTVSYDVLTYGVETARGSLGENY